MKKSIICQLLFIACLSLIPSITFALDDSVIAISGFENASGYICSSNSIGCSALGSIYKVNKNGQKVVICASSTFGNCSIADDSFVVDESGNTSYICQGSSLGCSALSATWKINKQNSNIAYVCPGNSLGCSTLSALYKISKQSDGSSYICPGNSIGSCSVFNVLYKFVRSSTNYSTPSPITTPTSQTPIQPPTIVCPLNSHLQGNLCACNDGYLASASSCITYNQSCQNKLGPNSYGDKQFCYCSTGFTLDATKTTCIPTPPLTQKQNPLVTTSPAPIIPPSCPPNSVRGVNSCICFVGYEPDETKKLCIKTIPKKPLNLSMFLDSSSGATDLHDEYRKSVATSSTKSSYIPIKASSSIEKNTSTASVLQNSKPSSTALVKATISAETKLNLWQKVLRWLGLF